MKKIFSIGIAGLVAALAVSFVNVAPPSSHAAAGASTATPVPANNCKKKNPSKDCGTGVSVTAYSGTFKVPVFQTGVVLKGEASKASHGVQIFAQRTTAAHTPKNGVAFRVFSLGHLPRLTLVGHGRLYQYGVARGTWAPVPAVTKSGIYAAVTR